MAEKHVLVVDDERAVQEAMVCLLNHLGCAIEVASSGAEALAKFDANHFDLVLVDFHMPGLTGKELLIEIKRRNPTIPVVLVTGDRIHGLSPDFDRVLFKPVSLAELKETLASFWPES